jgi:hypothetical protein
MFMSVDLPEPDEPTMATISPDSMVRLTSLSATTTSSPAGNSRRTCLSWISGGAARFVGL